MIPRVMTTLASSCIIQTPLDNLPVSYMHTIFSCPHVVFCCLLLSRTEVGMRVTLDWFATTDYPNSHKLIMVICDGLIKGSGETTEPLLKLHLVYGRGLYMSTTGCKACTLTLLWPPGAKRHNMAKG